MTRFKVRCFFEDDGQLEFDCDSATPVLTAAEKQGLSFVFGCRQGVCGTCKARLLEGKVDYSFASFEALTEKEREEGYLLTCCGLPKSDLKLKFPYDSVDVGVESGTASWLASVVKCEPLSSTVYRYSLQVVDSDNKALPVDFIPGQYMEINIPESNDWRAFSMASIADGSGYLEFMIRLQEQGRFSDYLRESAKEGQKVSVNGPYGQFVLQPTGRVCAFVAGSTGLAPLISMLRGMVASGDQREAHLFFGMGDYDAFFYEQELLELERQMLNLSLHLFLSNPPSNWNGRQGSPVDGFRQFVESRDVSPDVYICGPDGMIKATEKVCGELGIPVSQRFKEIFVPSGRT